MTPEIGVNEHEPGTEKPVVAQARYARRNREGKSRMLDELCEDYHYERKYVIKLLNGTLASPSGRAHPGPTAQRIFQRDRLNRKLTPFGNGPGCGKHWIVAGLFHLRR
jgi:hypothetical protein